MRTTHSVFIEERMPELSPARPIIIDFAGRPVLAAVYRISAVVISVLGRFWAAIVVLFLCAGLFTRSD
jgi:hypothetical protein